MRLGTASVWCILVVLGIIAGSFGPVLPATLPAVPAPSPSGAPGTTTNPSVGNFTNAINRIVTLLGLSGSGLLAIVWARVALSWFSNDITKKVQAKERARDALIGTVLFTAAVSGLFYGLAHWVVTGT